MARDALVAAVGAATVPVSVAGRVGTGFFVAPELVLTCAHVVGDTERPVEVNGGIAQVLPEYFRPEP